MFEEINIIENNVLKYFSQKPYEYIELLKQIIEKQHYKNVRKIIEQNTDIFSVYHYESVDLLTQKDNITYWKVREISSGKVAVINSNKEFILPFDKYGIVEATKDGKNIVCYWNREKILFDFNGKILKGKLENNIGIDKDVDKEAIVNMINEIRKSDDNNFSNLKEGIKWCDENIDVVKENTQKLEKSNIPHSIFDYQTVRFFTNNHNKRYFALKQKDSGKWGLVNAWGSLIVPFIYDDLGCFVGGEGDYIHMGFGGKYGLLDCLGNVAIEPISDNVILFFDGLARIEQNKKFGYIDSSGNIVIPVIYDEATRFLYGKAQVKLNNETFNINKKGERIE